jgi:hypothetical protein
MQPTNAADTRAEHRRLRVRPSCGIVGYPAAWAKLERVESNAQLAALDRAVRESGFAGPQALGWFAGCLLWEAGLHDYPTAPRGLKPTEIQMIEDRARASLKGASVALFPLLRSADKRLLVNGVKAPTAAQEQADDWATR